MTNKRAPEGSAGAGITCQLIPPREERSCSCVKQQEPGHGEMDEMERRREIFDLPTAHSAQQGHIGAGKRILPSSPRASSSSMLPSFGFSRCTYRTRGRPPAARNVDLPACGCIAFCWHLGLGDIHFWPFSGQSSLSAQQAESPPPQQRRVRVYTGAAPAAPPRHLAQPWSKGTWRIGIGDQPSRDKERSKHTLFRTLSRL